MSGGSTGLFNHDVDFITVLHFESVRGVLLLQSLSIKNESALVVGKTLSLAVGIHQLLQLGGPLDFEEDLGSILGLHLDVDMDVFLAGIAFASCSSCFSPSIVVSHLQKSF